MLVDVFALLSALVAMLTGGREVQAGWAVVYAIVASLVGFTMAFIVGRNAKKCDSKMLQVDANNWRIDGILSSGIALAFVAMVAIEKLHYDALLPYTDPLLVVVLACMTIPVPIAVIRKSWRKLMAGAAPSAVREAVAEIVNNEIKLPQSHDNYLRIAEAGRLVYIQWYVVTDANITLPEQDAIRANFFEKVKPRLANLNNNVVLDVVFTNNAHWALLSINPEPETAPVVKNN